MKNAPLLTGLLAACLVGCTAEQSSPQPRAQAASSSPSQSAPTEPTRPAAATPLQSPAGQSPPAQPAAPARSTSPTQSSRVVELTAKAVAGVPVGTAADEAERRLVAAIGKPTGRDPVPGCNGETGRLLSWDQLTVFLVDYDGANPVLSGWSAGASERYAYRLPYGTRLGETAAATQQRVPRSSGEQAEEGPLTGSYIVSTPEQQALLWIATGGTAADPIDEVSFQGFSCD